MHTERYLCFRAALAGAWVALALGTSGAQAAVAASTADALSVPGGIVDLKFDVDFGPTDVVFTSIGFGADFDTSKLSFEGGAAEYKGDDANAIIALLQLTGTLVSDDDGTDGHVGALWFADPSSPLILNGNGTLTLSFKLDPSFPIGTMSAVDFSLDGTDADLDPIDTVFARANVSAIPEPTSWVLMLAGSAGLAGWVRRRTRPIA